MDVFFAISEPTRRDILQMLARQGQMASSDIAKRFRSTPSAISQHLKVLREARLVRMEKQAQKHLYEIDAAALAQVEAWTAQLQTTWDQRFDRLDTVLSNRKEPHHGRRQRHHN